ncbi:hypothetical protein MNBD_BACTEROID05-655 [hydrothermal vent metagenome]|uniref:Uncharacterized protein n=1 Tax=hydrothermal vent metagenome TaxID=652676 RepID=A0A3B0T593_9ZZZZ
MLINALKQVFKRKQYLALAFIIAFVVFTLAVWLPNFKIIVQVVTSSAASLTDKWNILVGLLGSISTNFTFISASYTIIIAVFFGVNIAMIVYYMKRNKKTADKAGVAGSGLGGLISGFFGIGCAACGTIVLGPLLALIGAGGLIAFLPFNGQEFGFLGVGLLGFSIFLVAKKISAPAVCKVDERKNN